MTYKFTIIRNNNLLHLQELLLNVNKSHGKIKDNQTYMTWKAYIRVYLNGNHVLVKATS